MRFSSIKRLAVALVLAACAGCGVGDTSIVIEREVFIPVPGATPNAIARMTNDTLVIVGNSNFSWAIGTDSVGQILWKYEEPLDPQLPPLNQSAFRRVVPLSDGRALVCGNIATKDNPGGTAYIVILDSKGSVLERRKMYPDDKATTTYSLFGSCVPWAGGAALMGVAMNRGGVKASPWLVQLNGRALKVWEKTEMGVPGFDATETSDGNLDGLFGDGKGISVVIVSQNGETVAKRKTDYGEGRLVKGISPPNAVRLIAEDAAFTNAILTLGNDLQDVKPPKKVGTLYLRDGTAFGLADGSIVLFGSHSDGAPRSAIGWVNRQGASDYIYETAAPTAQLGSTSFRDAIPLSNNQFLAVRDQHSTNLANIGFVLAWVSFR